MCEVARVTCLPHNPPTMKLNSQDKSDLDKYTKFLAIRSAQIIVQSRLSEKVYTPCKPKVKGTDWFNLNIPDPHEVSAEIKKVLGVEALSNDTPVCVEISLRTSEGDEMVLETWCLSLLPEKCDTAERIVSTVYNRMGILLKSLVSVTRVTPAYKLSRRQGPDSFVIFYRFYMTPPVLHGLGDGFQQVRVGQICTPIGTLQLSVAYRTKMTISPTQTGRNNSIMLKSDHFNSNSSRKLKNSDDINDLTKPMRPGPFADPIPKQTETVELPDVARLLALGKHKQRTLIKNLENSSAPLITTVDVEDDYKEPSRENSPVPAPKMTTSNSSKISNGSMLKSVDEDYWMKELSAPFSEGGPIGELMQFYRQCKKCPPLQSPQKTMSPEEITHMIEEYESQLPEYDALVQSLCESPDNS